MKSLLTICWSPNGNSVCLWAKSSSSVIGKKNQKIDSYHFPVDSFARTEFYLTLETGHKCIFSFLKAPRILWFFDQSEAEKIKKKNKIECIECFAIKNDGRVNTDAKKIIFFLRRLFLRRRNGRENPTFHHYWLF